MTEDIAFNAEIKPVDESRVGYTATGGNRFILSIAYRGNKTVSLEDCTFYLRVEVGPEQEALVLNHEAAENIEAVRSGDHDIEIESFPCKKQFVWKISSNDETPIKPDKPIEVTFSEIISQTEPGTVKFTFEALIHGQEVQAQLIGELVKQSDHAGIIHFVSTTEEGKESVRSFYKSLLVILIIGVGLAVSIMLVQTKSSTDVRVLTPGWHESTKPVDNNKLEPSLLFNANNQTIYAVFRRKLPGNKEKGLLFQTENPFGDWASIKPSVPEGFATSPGVYCDDKLWFIGGSQIDPDNTSNKVWYFDPTKSKWAELDAAPWVRRMGHACLYIPADEKNDKKEKIWIMGGCDQNGNTLDDVWEFDVSSKTWSDTGIKLPGKRCMFSCVIFNNAVWLCGGVEDDPLSDKLLRDVFLWTGKDWQEKSAGLSFIEGDPMAACLQVFKGKLRVIGKTRKNGSIETFNYLLKVPTTESWEKQSSDALSGWGPDITLSYQLVNFRDELLIAKAMGYEEANYILKVYVPE